MKNQKEGYNRKLASKLKEAGFTNEDIAGAIGISVHTAQRYTAGVSVKQVMRTYPEALDTEKLIEACDRSAETTRAVLAQFA